MKPLRINRGVLFTALKKLFLFSCGIITEKHITGLCTKNVGWQWTMTRLWFVNIIIGSNLFTRLGAATLSGGMMYEETQCLSQDVLFCVKTIQVNDKFVELKKN